MRQLISTLYISILYVCQEYKVNHYKTIGSHAVSSFGMVPCEEILYLFYAHFPRISKIKVDFSTVYGRI